MSLSPSTVELLRWYARQRGPAGLQADEGSELSRRLGIGEGTVDDLVEAIDAAVERMDQGPYQEAARWLVSSGPIRWEAVKTRRHRAAEVFNIKTDAFRRKRTNDRPSRETEVLAALASVIDPTLEPGGADRSGDGQPAPANDGGRSRRWRFRLRRKRLASSVGVGAALLLALVYLWLRGGTESDGAVLASPVAECQQTGADERYGPVIRSEFAARGGAEVIGCALTAVTLLPNSPVAYQEFGEPGHTPRWVVVALDERSALTLPFAAWGSYRQMGGKDGTQAYDLAGKPQGLRVTADAAYLELENEVQLVAEEVDAPYFFVVAPVAAAWEERGGIDGPLGLPSSNLHVRNGRWRQEFRTGWLEAENGQTDIEWHGVDDPAAELPLPDVMRNRIIRQLDGTAWFVDAELHRKWIPDGLVWDCLGGEAEAVTANTPGYAVAQLPFGGQATCADSLVGPIDLAGYCRDRLGPEAEARTDEDSDRWSCVVGEHRQDLELASACRWQYGEGRRVVTIEAGSPTAWRCAVPAWMPVHRD